MDYTFWAIAGMVLIGVEFLLPGFVVVFFGVGALATALLTAVLPALRTDLAAQVLIWAGSSGLSLLALRRYLKPIFVGFRNRGGAEDLHGNSAEVVEPIEPGRPGRVRVHGTTWKATSHADSFLVGDIVDIVRNDSLTLEVTRSVMEEVSRLQDRSHLQDRSQPDAERP